MAIVSEKSNNDKFDIVNKIIKMENAEPKSFNGDIHAKITRKIQGIKNTDCLMYQVYFLKYFN